MADTSIRVSEELADALYDLKTRGDSYEDVIWRLIEQAAESQADPEATETRAAHEPAQEPTRDVDEEAPPESVGPTGPTGAPTETPTEADDVGVDIDRDQLRDELPGSGERLEARVDAIVAMYRYLQEYGHAEKSDLLALVDVDAVGYASQDSVWSNMVKGRDTLRALPGVETPPPGQTEWRYVDEADADSASGGVYDPTEEF